MKPLLKRLKNQVLVCDGAMGTILQEKGLEPGSAPEQWNTSHPEIIRDIHKSYVDAGSDILVTNTFGANSFKAERANLDSDVKTINLTAVKLAKEAAGNRAYVLGDIGPTGEFIEPVGNIKYEQLVEVFGQQAAALIEGGVDGIIIETMVDLQELKAAVEAAKAAALKSDRDIAIIATMTFQPAGKEYKTMMGVSVEQAVTDMVKLGIPVIGSNCGCGINQMAEVAGLMRRQLEEMGEKDTFLIVQANAGMPRLEGAKTVFDETAQDFAKVLPKLLDLKVGIIGGCCGTTPEHIRQIVRMTR